MAFHISIPHGLAGLLLGAGGLLLAHASYIDAKAVLAQVLLERAWAETARTGEVTKAWAWADTWPVARLTFPTLGTHAVVLKGASGEAMAFGPGLVDGTPLPGAPGTSVIAAHRDTHFEALQDLEVGDRVEVETPDGFFTFEMESASVVRWDQSGIEPGLGGPRLALVTCYPFGAKARGPLRYVVFLSRAE